MRGTKHFERHLVLTVTVDGREITRLGLQDPFHVTAVHVRPNWREWLRAVFRREFAVCVRVTADGVALNRWFEGRDVCERCQSVPLSLLQADAGDEWLCLNCYHDIALKPVTMAPLPRPEPQIRYDA